MFSLLKTWFGATKPSRSSRCIRRSVRPTLEALEGRLLPSTLTATTGRQLVVFLTSDYSAPGTLRYAVNQANADAHSGVSDTIVFAKSLDLSTITLSKPLEATPAKNNARIWIDGGGATLSGGGRTNIFVVDQGASVSLHNLTLVEGSAYAGGAIENAGSVSMGNVDILENTATYGGGVFNTGMFTFANCSISGNHAQYGGGLYNDVKGFESSSQSVFNQNIATNGGAVLNYGTLYETYDTYDYNVAGGVGGGLDNAGSASLAFCTIEHNRCNLCGGGAFDGGKLTVKHCSFYYDSAGHYGGGIYVNSQGSLWYANNTYQGDTAGYGTPNVYVNR
jgi:hypothetical protein